MATSTVSSPAPEQPLTKNKFFGKIQEWWNWASKETMPIDWTLIPLQINRWRPDLPSFMTISNLHWKSRRMAAIFTMFLFARYFALNGQLLLIDNPIRKQSVTVNRSWHDESTTVQVAQKQRLCRAFPFAFGAFPNIFWKESTYFFQYLPFNFLAERWLCNVSNLMRFSKFQLKFGTIYCIQNLYLD